MSSPFRKGIKMNKIGVIGGGPAGLMASFFAADHSDVTVWDSNEKTGKKLYITGKGRCNITNDKDISDFFPEILSNKEFLYSAFYTFTNEDLLNLLNSQGLKTKVERGGRVFPATDKSSDVIKTLERMVLSKGVKIKLQSEIEELSYDSNQERFQVQVRGKKEYMDKIILATGGSTYPITGSNGKGYELAQKFGHKITEISPGLIHLITEEKTKELQGLSLRNIGFICRVNGKKIYEDLGELLFTENGVSGPLILTASSKMKHSRRAEIVIDLKPGLNREQLDQRILRDFQKYSNKDIDNGLGDLLLKALIPVVLDRAKIPRDKKNHQITSDERRNLVETIKSLSFQVKDKGLLRDGIITIGGVDVKDINSSTMESKLQKGLYFAGEILDLDATTGGFNLQIAWSTGALAGRNCHEE